MTWLFGKQHTPIELPDIPRISRGDADIMHRAGLTLTQWMALSDTQRADIRWRIGA